jgi:hypothetical protein
MERAAYQPDLRPRTLPELLVYPVAQIAVTLLYYDLRVRREGFDIALAARRRGQEVANTP